jgi:hypothetical protein
MSIKKVIPLLLLMALFLTACGKGGGDAQKGSSNSSPIKTGDSTTQTSSIDNLNLLSNSWNGKLGVYTLTPKAFIDGSNGVQYYTGQSTPFIMTFFDDKSLNLIVLSNKPNNALDDTSDAYFADPNFDLTSILFGLGNKIFVILGGTIYSMNEDGTDHQKVLEIPAQYNSVPSTSEAYLVGDKVYLETEYMADTAINGSSSSSADSNGQKKALFLIDVNAKSYKLLYSFDNPSITDSSNLLGIIGNKAYYLYQTYTQNLQSHTQAAYGAQMNGLDTKVFSMDLSTGKRTDLLSAKSQELDKVILRGNYIFYQNRKNGEIVRFDPSNNEKKTLVSNLSTYIEFLNMDIINNKLFYYVDNQMADAYNKTPKDNESYYVDINTGVNTKINYRVPCDNGTTKEFNGFAKETPDYYIIPTKYIMKTLQYANSSETYTTIKETQYGKVKKTDLWNFLNGDNSIQPISWTGNISGI